VLLSLLDPRCHVIKRSFQPTQLTQRMQGIDELTQRKEHNEMASLLDRPITAASDDGVPLARCQAVADTLRIIEIKFDLHHKLHK